MKWEGEIKMTTIKNKILIQNDNSVYNYFIIPFNYVVLLFIFNIISILTFICLLHVLWF